MTTKKEWLKIMEQPLFNCCGDCPLVKRIEEMVKNSPASSKAIDPFDRPIIGSKEKPKTHKDDQREMLEKVRKQIKEAEAEVEKEAQLEALARFCGGKRWWSHESSGQQSEPGWLFPSLKEKGYAWPVIMCDRWNPREDGNQLLMVLEALAKQWVAEFARKLPDCCILPVSVGYREVLRKLSYVAGDSLGKNFNLGNAVCAAGLEILNQKGGE